MAGWLDLFSLFVTICVFGGTIYGVVYAVKQISASIQTTKDNLKTKGYDISDKGVSIKTSKRFDRQDYIDSTQRSMLKAMTAASFNRRNDSVDYTPPGSQDNSHSNSPSPYTSPTPPASTSGLSQPSHVERMNSSKSSDSGEKKRRKLFGKKAST